MSTRKYQDEYNYRGPRDDRFHENRGYTHLGDQQNQTSWNRPVGNDGDQNFGRSRHSNNRESDYNRNYNNDYNRNYNNDYNQEYNSYHLYRRDHSQDSNHGDSSNRGAEERSNYGARATGDYSGGTRYGEGGSTYGGGSAYGHSYYGPANHRHGTHRSDSDRGDYHSVNVQNGYGDYLNPESRNYGSYGGYRHDELSDNRRADYRSGANTGYNRGSSEYAPTGYGSTRYNNRDQDRARSAYSNNSRPQNNRSRSDDDYIRSRYRKDYNREL